MQGVEAEGWRFVAFTRLVPLFPFNLLNYGLGLTRIGFLPYLLATLVFMLPGALAYTYLGFAGREAVAGSEGLIQNALIALALLAVVAFLPRLVTRLRLRPMLPVGTLKQRLDAGDDLLVLDVRTPADFVGEQGHLAEAVSIPLETLPERLDELGADLERPIALICRTDRRSAKAAALLARRGFGQVQVVQGGMTAWLANGWAVGDAAAAECRLNRPASDRRGSGGPAAPDRHPAHRPGAGATSARQSATRHPPPSGGWT
jgi:rhodanese-related sulfurtransferase